MTRTLIALTLWSVVAPLQAADDRTPPKPNGEVRRYARATFDDLRSQIQSRIATSPEAGPNVRAALDALWNAASTGDGDRAELVARSAALVDDRAAALVHLGSGTTDPWHVRPQPWLYQADVDPWVRDQLRLYFGRWLAQRKMYDAALEMLAGLEPEDVVDPAVLLFYQGTAYHHQLRKNAGLRALDRLLTDVRDCPQRFEVVAGLMREDLKKLEDESLDHIARRMDDVHRRLDGGDGGRRTQRIEDGIVDSLDKIIEELEKQQQQQQGKGGGQSSKPMQDSRIAKQKGPGNVDRKDIGRKSEWGDLPVETREQIRQQLGKDLPAHYYDLIQQYFGKRAAENSPGGRTP